MASLDDYLFDMEAVEEEAVLGQGAVAPALDMAATGTCGVVTLGEGLALPALAVAVEASWLPVGVCRLALPEAVAATAGWRPAWGGMALPAASASAQGAGAVGVDVVLTPLFSLAISGILGAAAWPAVSVDGLSQLSSVGEGGAALPVVSALAYACGLDSPVTSGAGSAAVVALLGQGDPALARASLALAGGAAGSDDAVASALLAAVAGSLAYVEDAGDVWTCAAGAYFRGTGDCEDGAILLHALLLAAGAPPDRLVTAFGRVGIDRQGHAWVAYRRHGDGRWVALDWTLGTGQSGVDGLPVLGESPVYALVDYALTHAAFFAVRGTAAAFFSRLAAEFVILPPLALAGAAVHGARAAVSLDAGWLAAAGRGGGAGRIAVSRPDVAATAGSAGGAAAFRPLVAGALAGAAGGVRLPAAGASGGGAPAGQAVCRLARPEMAGRAVTAALAAAVVDLPWLRLAGQGIRGLAGWGSGRLPLPGTAGWGLPGGLAPGGAALPCWRLEGLGGPVSVGEAALVVCPWRVCGQGCPSFVAAGAGVCCGEEWR